jgi:peptidoglycan biosynthesis protein MviN/MurJ (putative lipid II flippase)
MSRYTWAAACAVIQPALLILFAIYSPESSSEAVLAIALLIGKGAIAITTVGLVRYGCAIRLSLLGEPISAIRQTFKVAGVYGCANFITATSAFYFDFMASGLASGVLTSVSLAQRVSTLPITVIVNPILEIARVKFAIAQAGSNTQLLSKEHQELTRSIVYLSVPVAAFMYIFSNEIITTLFQRGAYQADSVSISAHCLKVFALATPFVSVFMLNGRAVESYQRLLWPSLLGTFGHLMMMTVTYILVSRWGYLGIPYARVFAEIFYFSPFGFLALRYFMHKLDIRNLVNSVAVALTATGLPVMLFIIFNMRELLSLFSSRWAMLITITTIFFTLCGILFFILDSKVRTLLASRL